MSSDDSGDLFTIKPRAGPAPVPLVEVEKEVEVLPARARPCRTRKRVELFDDDEGVATDAPPHDCAAAEVKEMTKQRSKAVRSGEDDDEEWVRAAPIFGRARSLSDPGTCSCALPEFELLLRS
jgi:hypothetical protein